MDTALRRNKGADVCGRLAELGYLAIAPTLYSRQGDPLASGCTA
ncbi:dienelactone hydrolase family protein [Trinickia fusca]